MIDISVPGGKWLSQDSSYKDMLPLKDKVQRRKENWYVYDLSEVEENNLVMIV